MAMASAASETDRVVRHLHVQQPADLVVRDHADLFAHNGGLSEGECVGEADPQDSFRESWT